MIQWDAAAMGLIYLVYGLAFFVLGVVALMLPKQNTAWRFAPHLSLLAAFGLLHGLAEFVEMQMQANPAEWLNGLRRLLLPVSFVPLMEFGRRTWIGNHSAMRLPAPWLYGAAGLAVAMLTLWTTEPLVGLTIGARWFVGAPAALLTGLALLPIPHANTNRRNTLWLRIVALTFIIYSVLTLVLFQGDPRLPTWLPTQADFLMLFGVPVQLLRTLCAVAMTLGVIVLVRLAGKSSQLDAVVFESNEAMVITDAQTVILRINPAFTESTGYTADEAVGRKINLLKSGYHDQAFYAVIWESIHRTGTWQGEIWDKRKNGEIYPNWLTITAVNDATGALIYYVGTHTDITERKLAQQLLQDKERMLSESQRIAHIGSWALDLTTGYMSWSEEMYRIFGVTPETFGHSMQALLDLVHPEDRAPIELWFSDCLAGKAMQELDLCITLPDGTERTLRGSGGLQWDEMNRPLRLVGSGQDITERKCMENQLKASEQKFRSIIDASPVPMALDNDMMNIVFLNQTFVQTFGYSMDDIPTLADWWPKAYPDPDYRYWVKTTWRAELEKAKREKTDFTPLELAIRCKDNSVKIVLASAAAIHSDIGGMNLVILYDITQRKYLEQQDKAHLNELAHVTRLGLMGEMASGIAHEVNQPLTAISSYTQVSLNLINAEYPDLMQLADILSKTQQQALRAGQIIKRMREFVKSHATNNSSADINALIHEAVGLCMADIEQNSIKLTFELEDNLPPVCVDYIQIEQVIINLIRNSIEALQNLPAGRLRQLTTQSHLLPNNAIRVRVKDNGPGLDQDQQQKIFMPFYTTKSDGMGMGLSISHSLIEAHEGTFHFNSIPGKGTTFYFTLPIEKN